MTKRVSDCKQKEWKTRSVGSVHARAHVPAAVDMGPASRVINQDHQADRCAAKYIEGVKTEFKQSGFVFKCTKFEAINPGQRVNGVFWRHGTGWHFHTSDSSRGRGARIGAGTRIWHFTHVMGTARIGERCNISQNVYIDSNTVIGNGVKIQNNVSVYQGVVVEDDVFLGPSMVFTNVINPRVLSNASRSSAHLCTGGDDQGGNATIICGVEIGVLP